MMDSREGPRPPTVAPEERGFRGPDRGPTAAGPVAETDLKAQDVAAEAAVAVVVLPVDVAGDRATQGDRAGAWGDHREVGRGEAKKSMSFASVSCLPRS